MSTDDGSKDRWRRADEILAMALETPPPQRDAAIADACAGDEELRRQVEGLLLADAQAGDFLEPPRGGATTPATDVAAGTVLAGRYRVEESIGHGGMGAVHRARDLLLDTCVAVKVLDSGLLRFPGRLEAFRREVRLARLVTHPNVCRIHDIVEDGPLAFITMEHVEGESLAERLRRTPEVSVPWCTCVLRDVARGLAAAHAAGVIHRDLKPGNVLLRQGTDRAVVADFGIAAEATRPGQAAVEHAGTSGYMSPEQAAGGPVDARSDLYALGVVAYRMATGRMPDEGGPALDGLPPELAGFVGACLAPDPGDRPCDAEAALKLLAGPPEPTSEARQDVPPANRTRRARASRAAGLGVVLAALALLVALALTWRPRGRPAPPAEIVVAASEASRLDPVESWRGAALQRLVINELADGWAIEARGPAEPAESAAVRPRIWRDTTGRLRAAVALEGGSAPREHEVQGDSLRTLAEAAARRVVEGLVPAASRHPTAPELRAVGASDPEAWRQLRRARRAARMQHWQRVRELAREAARRDPRFALPWLELALSYDEADSARRPALERAVELGERAQGLSPFSRLLVEFARHARDEDEAGIVRVFQAASRLELDADDLLYFKTRHALMYVYQGDAGTGIPLLEWVAEKWPQDAAAPKRLAGYHAGYDAVRSLPLALRFGEKAIALAPEDVVARAHLARALLLSGDETAARAHAGIIATADPEEKQGAFEGEYTNTLFALHMALGEREEAAADARRLLAEPGLRHAQGQVALASVELSRGALDEGLKRLGDAAREYEALGLGSLAAATYTEHAGHSYGLGRYSDVLASSARVQRLALKGRRQTAALRAWADLMEGLVALVTSPAGARPAMAAQLRERLDAGSAEARSRRARAQREVFIRHALGDWTGVADAYRELETPSGPPAAAYYAADAFERLGRRDVARRIWEQLATHPNAWSQPHRRAQAWLRLGALRARAGDTAGAAAAWQSLLRHWDRAPRDAPEIREAQLRLAAIEWPASRK